MTGALLVSPVERDELTRAEARALTGEARAALQSALEWASLAVELVERAWAMRADKVLNYPSWEDYCATEFAGLRDIRIPIPTRVEIVEALTEAGMSTRKVGAVLRVNDQTVRADIARARAPHAVVSSAASVTEAVEQNRSPAPDERSPSQVELALADLAAAGRRGLTWFELGAGRGWHHGSLSSVLSRLDRRGLVERTASYRCGSAVYVARRPSVATAPSSASR